MIVIMIFAAKNAIVKASFEFRVRVFVKSAIIVKFVVSRCAFCSFWVFCSVNHLSGPFRKYIFTCTSSKGHGLRFVIGGSRSVLFVSCFKVRCFVIVLFWAIMN